MSRRTSIAPFVWIHIFFSWYFMNWKHPPVEHGQSRCSFLHVIILRGTETCQCTQNERRTDVPQWISLANFTRVSLISPSLVFLSSQPRQLLYNATRCSLNIKGLQLSAHANAYQLIFSFSGIKVMTNDCCTQVQCNKSNHRPYLLTKMSLISCKVHFPREASLNFA